MKSRESIKRDISGVTHWYKVVEGLPSGVVDRFPFSFLWVWL